MHTSVLQDEESTDQSSEGNDSIEERQIYVDHLMENMAWNVRGLPALCEMLDCNCH